MAANQYEVWVADLNPQIGTEGTEPGKTRPVLVIQSNLLNKIPHPSTVICPITTKVEKDAVITQGAPKKRHGWFERNCDIMIDQIRAIDNSRLVRKIGNLPATLIEKVKEKLLITLDLE